LPDWFANLQSCLVCLQKPFARLQRCFVWEQKPFACLQSLSAWKKKPFACLQSLFAWEQRPSVSLQKCFAGKQKALDWQQEPKFDQLRDSACRKKTGWPHTALDGWNALAGV
jgi:hypothetical protein